MNEEAVDAARFAVEHLEKARSDLFERITVIVEKGHSGQATPKDIAELNALKSRAIAVIGEIRDALEALARGEVRSSRIH